MAEEITRTVENVDRLFSEIVVNGERHVSENYVPPARIGQQAHLSSTNNQAVQETQGEDVYGVKLNDVLHNLKDQATAQDLTDEITARQNADTALQNNINTINSKIPSTASASNQLVDNASLSAVETDVANIQAVIPASATPSNQLADASSVSAVQESVSDIEDLIPSQASDSNQLADKDFVNSSIATNTANFIGTFESVTQLRAYAGTVTNNDYAFVRNTVVQYNGGDFPNVTTLNSYDKTALTNGDYAWVVNAEDNTKYDLYRFDIVEQSWVLRATKIDKSQDVLNSMFNRYKATVSGSTVTWLYEYSLNNSSFTAQQWATINSGLTQGSVDQDILDAINALDVASQGGNNKYIKAIQQTNGLISATEGTIDTTVTQNSSNPVTSGAVYDAIQSGGGGGLDWPTIKQDIATDLGLTASQYNGNSATATVAYRIRTTAPSSPVDGDIWIE